MTIKPGDRIPSVTLKLKTDDGVQDVATDDFFKGKKIVLFALPGAYTPTCSARHLPGFVDKIEQFREKGVDTVACISVNDAFVMGAWGRDQKTEGKVVMLADGNAEFARAAGLEFDASGFGMGTRSQRYALIAEDGVVKVLHVEKPGAFEVSSAEAVLAAL